LSDYWTLLLCVDAGTITWLRPRDFSTDEYSSKVIGISLYNILYNVYMKNTVTLSWQCILKDTLTTISIKDTIDNFELASPKVVLMPFLNSATLNKFLNIST